MSSMPEAMRSMVSSGGSHARKSDIALVFEPPLLHQVKKIGDQAENQRGIGGQQGDQCAGTAIRCGSQESERSSDPGPSPDPAPAAGKGAAQKCRRRRCDTARRPAERRHRSTAPAATAPHAFRPAVSGEKRKASRSAKQSGRRRQKRPPGHRSSSTRAGHKAPPAVQKCSRRRKAPPPLLTTIETCRFPELLSITAPGIRVSRAPAGTDKPRKNADLPNCAALPRQAGAGKVTNLLSVSLRSSHRKTYFVATQLSSRLPRAVGQEDSWGCGPPKVMKNNLPPATTFHGSGTLPFVIPGSCLACGKLREK